MWNKQESFKEALIKWADGSKVKCILGDGTEYIYDQSDTDGFLESSRGYGLHVFEITSGTWYVWN